MYCTVKFSKEVGPINQSLITSRVCVFAPNLTVHSQYHTVPSRPLAASHFPILNPTLHTVQLELAIQNKQAISSRVLTIKRPKYFNLFVSKSPRLFLIVPTVYSHTIQVVCSKHEHADDDDEDDDELHAPNARHVPRGVRRVGKHDDKRCHSDR